MSGLALPVLAVLAGMISFSSPCALPLLPAYLAYTTALPVSSLSERSARKTVLKASLLFVAGFTTVFTALGASFAVVGSLLLRNMDWMTRAAGVGIAAMGLMMLGVIRLPFLMRERRFDLSKMPSGPGSAFMLGAAFGFGWAPCIGPVLASILVLAGATQTVAWGAILLALYGLGLGIPFVVVALWYQRASRSVAWLRRNSRRIEVVGGVLLVGVGVMFVFGAWRALFIPLQRTFTRLGWPPL
ncbi:MAG: cytochrome c biogenesis protein CcdA [Actinobacteria bacterium]|jgi:cytochrome c-type biogenesis protein|nr:cytochrome c biogenesis protein CcdA [Actinomycetota bacterium]MBU1494758.1 cytochrome c biogenesis protein CcdA [Actinomycetota bacterium]MBU1866463.1 cytochrome c biogenesis protein CcdA [Actinomycetota bacterium]